MAEPKDKTGQDIDKLEADFDADAGNFVPLARAYMDRNLPVQAIRVCKRGLSANPGAKHGRLALAMAYYHNFEDSKAEAELKRVIRTEPESFVAHRSLGEIFLERSQEKKAVEQFMRAIEIEQADPHTRHLLESLDEKLPELKSTNGAPADNWLPRSAHLTHSPPRPFWRALFQILIVAAIMAGVLVWYHHYVDVSVQVREAIKKASTLIPRDNYDDLLQAEKELDRALALRPAEEKALSRQSFVRTLLISDHDQKDRMEALKKHLARMNEDELPNPERFAVEAFMKIRDRKAEEADKYLTEIVSRAIKQQDIFLSSMIFGIQGMAKLELGKLKEAREDYSRASRFSGDSPHYQAKFADVYLREGNQGRAIRYFRDALRVNPDHVYSNLRMAYAYIQQGKQLERAKKTLDDMMNPQSHPIESFSPPQLGLLYLVRGEYALAVKDEGPPKAAEYLRKALEAYDESAEIHDLAGRLAAMNKDGAKTDREFARALQLDPRLPRVYFNRAESLFMLDRKQEAVSKLQEFERFLKPTVAYHVTKGDLLMRMEDHETALAEFKKAVEIDELSAEARYQVARCYQAMGAVLGDDKTKQDKKREYYNLAREEYENSLMLPGGERPEVFHMMGLIYLDAEAFPAALDNMAKAVMELGKANASNDRIAVVYGDIAKIFHELGGEEGEKREREYLAKKAALLEGKTVEQVEKEWAEKEKQEKKRPPKRRRRRRRHR
ncbi:MAG: tetratricopeptide repeat protein [Deltaproteobacteria bacterium]|nr:tetratricopeptide repeat protein [Deltaproteobacteria bacterium]